MLIIPPLSCHVCLKLATPQCSAGAIRASMHCRETRKENEERGEGADFSSSLTTMLVRVTTFFAGFGWRSHLVHSPKCTCALVHQSHCSGKRSTQSATTVCTEMSTNTMNRIHAPLPRHCFVILQQHYYYNTEIKSMTGLRELCSERLA